MMCVYPNTGLQLMSMEEKVEDSAVDPKLLKVIESYVDVFELPKALPPKRAFDHRIPLLSNT
jgi:hypothetical protein